MKLGKNLRAATIAAIAIGGVSAASAQAVDPYLGQIMFTAASYCPEGWMLANGDTLAVNTNAALYGLLSNTFDGTVRQPGSAAPTTFKLPDLRGSVVIGVGVSPGRTTREWGAKGGAELVVLTTPQLPPHSHTAVGPVQYNAPTAATESVYGADGGESTPVNVVSGEKLSQSVVISKIGNTGDGAPVSTMPPFVALNACIATTGTWPTRP